MKIHIIIILFSLLNSCTPIDKQTLGTTKYNQEIKDTENFIAYIHNPNSNSMAPMRSQEIFLVNSLSGKQIQLTNDNFSDSDLSWSPDGEKLLICSRRLKNRMAQQHDNRNQGFLFIFDFQTGKEISLEENISAEIDKLGLKYKNEGFEVKKNKHYEPDNESPFWISKDRIGFIREIYFGTSYANGELTTTDTFGNNLILHRNLFEKRKWNIHWPIWINQDSVIVSCSKTLLGESSYKIYDVNKKEYFPILPKTYFPSSISHDKTKLICYKDDSYVQYNLENSSEIILLKDVKDIKDVILSPQNDQIAFVKSVEYEADIFLMDLNSKGIKQLTFDGGRKYSLSWSPKKAL